MRVERHVEVPNKEGEHFFSSSVTSSESPLPASAYMSYFHVIFTRIYSRKTCKRRIGDDWLREPHRAAISSAAVTESCRRACARRAVRVFGDLDALSRSTLLQQCVFFDGFHPQAAEPYRATQFVVARAPDAAVPDDRVPLAVRSLTRLAPRPACAAPRSPVHAPPRGARRSFRRGLHPPPHPPPPLSQVPPLCVVLIDRD